MATTQITKNGVTKDIHDRRLPSNLGSNGQVLGMVNGAINWTDIDVSGKENISNKVTSFQETPDDTHYPSEKLVKDSLDAKGTYSKPGTGIPKTDLASDVQTSLGKADTALQTLDGEVMKYKLSGGGIGTLPVSTYWKAIGYGNGKFVVGAEGTYVATSTDLTTWTHTSTSIRFDKIAYGAGKFVGIHSKYSDAMYAYYSTDGLSWTRVTIQSGQRSASNIKYINGKFYITFLNAPYIACSTDGMTWSTISVDSKRWHGIAYGNGMYVAVTQNNQIAYSSDTINWSYTSVSPTYIYDVVYGNGKFVAVVSSSSQLLYSSDGITWSVTNVPYANWVSVTYGNGTFIAVNTSSTFGSPLIYSTDGINWTSSSALSGEHYNIIFAKGLFVTVKMSSNEIDYSSDGINWNNLTYGLESSDQSISFKMLTPTQTPVSTDDLIGKEDLTNKVTTWSETTTNIHYPSEKLVKDSLDLKANASDVGVKVLQRISSAKNVVPNSGIGEKYKFDTSLTTEQVIELLSLVAPAQNSLYYCIASSDDAPYHEIFVEHNEPEEEGEEEEYAIQYDYPGSVMTFTIFSNLSGGWHIDSTFEADFTGETLLSAYQDVEGIGSLNSSIVDLFYKEGTGGYSYYITDPASADHDLAEVDALDDHIEDTTVHVTSSDKTNWNAKGTYSKPATGIPKTDLASDVQTSLGKADTALQTHQDISGKENTSNKVTSLSSSSTDDQYPSAKCVYDIIGNVESLLSNI